LRWFGDDSGQQPLAQLVREALTELKSVAGS
jgi:hypothetical protein